MRMFRVAEDSSALNLIRSLFYLLPLAIGLVLLVILFLHLDIILLPMVCFLFGAALRTIVPRHFLTVFSFLFPLVSGLAVLDNHGLPFNYLLLPLCMLLGIFFGESILSGRKVLNFVSAVPRFYLLFLSLLLCSLFFVFLRWSNLTIPSLAFLADTQVDPDNTRFSFAAIFPILELSLYAVSVLFFFYLRQSGEKRPVLVGFLTGHALSILVSYGQSFLGKRSIPGLGFGLASDSTSFGFLTSLAFLISWYLYDRYREKALGLLFYALSVLGVFNSTTRIGLLSAVVIGALLFFNERKKWKYAVLAIAFLGAIFLSRNWYTNQGEFNFFNRIKFSSILMERALKEKKIDGSSLEQLSSHRNQLWGYSFNAMKQYPLSGIGVGNFLFWVRYRYHNEDIWHDLPANQFLWISVSVGLTGLLVFLLFCGRLLRQHPARYGWMLGLVFLILLFGNYLWAPEAFLAFWLVASLGYQDERTVNRTKKIIWPGLVLFVIFFLSNLAGFNSLHPKKWYRDTAAAYDYGFWYTERDAGRKTFCWTRERAGIYLYLDERGRSQTCRIVCGAPLAHMQFHRQKVDIYWKRKLFQTVVFRENTSRAFQIIDEPNGEGFLEFRVRPTFNLKRMGLGPETRDLGIRFGVEGK